MATEVVIFIMPQKIERQRRNHMMNAAKKNKIRVETEYNDNVNHVVTECDTKEQALAMLKVDCASSADFSADIVNIKWFVDSMKAKRPINVTEKYTVKPETKLDDGMNSPLLEPTIAEWSCLRPTPLKHHNKKLCDAIETLQRYAELRDGDSDYSRALAFRRASCVLKTLPRPLRSVREVAGIKDMGKHVLRVLKEILEEGFSEEVETILSDPWFEKMKLFDTIFGVGPGRAKKWIEQGISTIDEATDAYQGSDWRVNYGLAFYHELNDPVVRNEADNLRNFVATEAKNLVPGMIVELTGGFRRGKASGHDVDLLFTHPVEGKEIGILEKLLEVLEDKGLILYGRLEKSTYTMEALYTDFKLSMRGQLDHFQKWIGIMKIPKSWKKTGNAVEQPEEEVVQQSKDSCQNSYDEYEPNSKRRKVHHDGESPYSIAGQDRDWVARRVDLIISPYSQYFYALVGWTGSKHFNRDLRLYGTRVKSKKLSSHGLWDYTTNKSIPASSEKEVFDNLQVPFFPPEERNC